VIAIGLKPSVAVKSICRVVREALIISISTVLGDLMRPTDVPFPSDSDPR
jgi:hypothetical protein